MIGQVGTNTKFDRVLEQYFTGRQGDVLQQLAENETDALLLAILLELQEQNGNNEFDAPTEERPDQHEADYFATEEPLPIESTNEADHTLNWGFPATSVTIWGFNEPIYVAFRSNGENRKVPLEPSDAPFTAAPEGGLDTSEVRVRKPSSDSADTQVKIMAFE